MERYYYESNTYQTATINNGKTTDVLKKNTSPADWYTLSIIKATDFDFTIQATPTHAQATNDTRCQSLTFNSAGAKGITLGPSGTPSGTVSQCW